MSSEYESLFKTATCLNKENEELKRQIKVAKNLQSSLIDSLSVEKVIKVEYRKGTGTKKDPVRIVNSYWDRNGNYLFSLVLP